MQHKSDSQLNYKIKTILPVPTNATRYNPMFTRTF